MAKDEIQSNLNMNYIFLNCQPMMQTQKNDMSVTINEYI